MSRISIPDVAQPLEASRPLLAAAKQQRGVMPNLMRLSGHSPAALEGYPSLNGALNKGRLDAKLRERIALAVEFNGCDYCLSAHLARNVARLGGEEIDAARDGRSSDPRAAAALRVARRVAEAQGRVCDADLAALRDADVDEGVVIEIVVTVALNVLTSDVETVARTDIDFPRVAARIAA